MQVDVENIQREKVGTVELSDAVFASEISKALLWDIVKSQRASKRQGTHKTKGRSEVRGGGAKPFKQKGTGRARQGSSRSPQMVGGGVVFGPTPRDYGYRLPRSARRSALRSALALRMEEGALVVLDKFELEAPKTKSVVDYVAKVGKSVLIVDADNQNLSLSTQNIKKTKYLLADALNVYDILDHEKLVVTQAALDAVVGKATVNGKKEKRSGAEAAA